MSDESGDPPPPGPPPVPGAPDMPSGYAVPGSDPSQDAPPLASASQSAPPGPPHPADAAGPASSWQQVAPEHVARMYQPGVVPLRPLNLGDIFGGAIGTIRRNPEATIGMSVVVLALFLVPSFLISLSLQFIPAIGAKVAGLFSVFSSSVVGYFAALPLTGFIIYVVSEAALGDKVGLSQTWSAVRGRILALIGVTFLTSFLLVLPPLAAAVVLTITISTGEPALIAVGAVVLLIGVFGALWLGIRLILTPAPVVLERAGPIQAIRRAWGLSSGTQFWRLLGITILAQLLVTAISWVLSTPVQALTVVGSETLLEDESVILMITAFGQHLTQFLAGLVVTPFSAGITALLYLDQRIRREGLDIAMQQAASVRTAQRHRP